MTHTCVSQNHMVPHRYVMFYVYVYQSNKIKNKNKWECEEDWSSDWVLNLWVRLSRGLLIEFKRSVNSEGKIIPFTLH